MVWQAIKDPVVQAQWHPFVTHIAGEHELGAVRRCTAHVGGKDGFTEEVCSLYDEGRKIMWDIKKDSTGFSDMVSDWSAGFTLQPHGEHATLVTAQSLFRPKKFFVHLMMPMIRYKFHSVQKQILGGLKQYVEKQ